MEAPHRRDAREEPNFAHDRDSVDAKRPPAKDRQGRGRLRATGCGNTVAAGARGPGSITVARLADDVIADAGINLGRLKGNIGDQNYAIPAGTDLSTFKSVLIWCKRFNTGFGVASLTQ